MVRLRVELERWIQVLGFGAQDFLMEYRIYLEGQRDLVCGLMRGISVGLRV